MTVTMKAYGLSDVGCVRSENQDSFLISSLDQIGNGVSLGEQNRSQRVTIRRSPREAGSLLIVADGVGGGPGGRVASRAAIEEVARVIDAHPHCNDSLDRNDSGVRLELVQAAHAAEQKLHAIASARPVLDGMATTLTMAYIVWPQLYLLHIGDSRAYLFRNASLMRLSRDHTVGEQLAERFGPGAGDNSPVAAHLWNVIGGGGLQVEPDISWMELQAGDRLLLCTDGLTHTCSDAQLARILKQDQPLEDCVRRLVLRAKGDGGTDNITAVLADFSVSAGGAVLADEDFDPYAETVPDVGVVWSGL